MLDERYYTLLTKIDGKVLKNYFEGDFIKRGNNIGKSLAELHIGLSKITDEIKGKIVAFDNDLIAELNGWVIDEIDKYVKKSTLDKNEINIFKECINELLNGFRNDYYKLPRQVIHRDFHGGNIIFKNEDIVGVIDFDLSQINARLFDICYLCTGSLTTIFNDTEMRDKWIQFIKAFIQGYQSVNKLTSHEIKSMKNMMLSIEIVMVAYFAREGYEDIANNNIKMANYLNELWQNKWDGENGGIIVK
ncbi:phosphotransferase [Clostridium sp. NSJ-6]|uniref:Phosphotransferase n=1 Tax=Clostridium hominis TaxID=2763036 RepID=A0ABR7DHU8_9CLOT|nr:phosphotransferase [Clostridium hominis]MDU2670444.1 phosphotransferase [Clostridium sp.]